MPWMFLTVLACGVLGCGGEAPDTADRPADGFAKDSDVRILSPANGETTTSPLVVDFEAGADVAAVRLDNQYGTLVDATAIPGGGQGEFVVDIVDGRYELSLVGLDDRGDELSRTTIAVRIHSSTDTPWVTIQSPSDGATVPNPVRFVVDAADTVDEIELLADGWSLGTVSPGELLTYEFSGTGYARDIEALGLADGEIVATDAITLTVDAGTTPLDSSFNQRVLDVIATYPTDGSYGYYWPSDSDWAGTTRDIWYRGELVAEGDPEHRSYCSGITWETFMRAWEGLDEEMGGDGTINGMTVDDLYEFRTDWYVRELWGDGVGIAVENAGIGERITDLEDVRPGDYVQIWRYSGSGHTFVFIDWERDDDGHIIGLRYWSSQGSTDGIGYNEEYFGSGGSNIDPSYFFAARIYDPVDWLPRF
ncbi:MAG: hypothetical protein D6798_16480 [Deltaproteobacteria bacterium]|nr:MAG: hypothetical protein D6798_16480 [Deltaproteobacteria bacterium]